MFAEIVSLIQTVSFRDIVDVLLVAFLIFQAIKLVRDTRAAQLVKGLALILLLYLVSDFFDLVTMNFLIAALLQISATALLVVFQPELRRALEQMGRSRIGSSFFQAPSDIDEVNRRWNAAIQEIGDAVKELSDEKTGALLVIERQTMLGEITATGTLVDSAVSQAIICNLFFPNSPLHDGAVIVRDARVHSAGCFLPLSENNEISKQLGTRHRAALGMSENSDAIVIIVSEETGVISSARNGRLKRGYTSAQLVNELRSLLISEKRKEEKQGFKPLFMKGKK